MITISQLEEMVKTKEGREEVQTAIEGARVFFATTHITYILDKLGIDIPQTAKQNIFDVIATTCFSIDDEHVLAAMSSVSEELETVIKTHNLTNYDC